jgi:hypothetical protein
MAVHFYRAALNLLHWLLIVESFNTFVNTGHDLLFFDLAERKAEGSVSTLLHVSIDLLGA